MTTSSRPAPSPARSSARRSSSRHSARSASAAAASTRTCTVAGYADVRQRHAARIQRHRPAIHLELESRGRAEHRARLGADAGRTPPATWTSSSRTARTRRSAAATSTIGTPTPAFRRRRTGPTRPSRLQCSRTGATLPANLAGPAVHTSTRRARRSRTSTRPSAARSTPTTTTRSRPGAGTR